MTSQEIKDLTGQYIMNTYGRFPVAIDHGEGARLYDPEGRKYIDFTSGIGVTDLGYGYQPWVDAVSAQAKKLGHTSNLFYTEPPAKLAEILCKRTGMSCAFFANGGGEANEGIIKLARKYSFDKYGKGRSTIVTLRNSFHGRTITTLMATGQDVFHNYFFPFTEGFRYVGANDLSALESQGDDVCGVLLELVQRAVCCRWIRNMCRPWRNFAKRGTGCCWRTRCRPAWAGRGACSRSSSTASCRMPPPLPRALPGGCL